MPYPNISENKRVLGAVTFYFDPLHKQIVGLTTREVFRKTVAQIQTEIDTIDENATKQVAAKSTIQTVLDNHDS